MTVIPVPTLAEAKVKVGEPPRLTSFAPEATPESVAVPVAVAAVLSSYTLSSPVNPVMVNTPRAVVSFVLSPVVS